MFGLQKLASAQGGCGHCHSALVVITKYHRLGAETTDMYFLTVLELGSPRSRCQHGRELFFVLQTDTFSSCPHTVERASVLSDVSFYKNINPVVSGPHSCDLI